MTTNSVVLVHGIDDTAAKFCRLRSYLSDRGWCTHAVDLIPNDGSAGLDVLAEQLRAYIDGRFTPNQPVDIVGYSMGGLIGRYYVQQLGGVDRVQRLVTVASPHQGTLSAYLRSNIGACQMRQGSPFLLALGRSLGLLEQIRVTSIWTPLDLMILPAESSRLPVGRQVQIPIALHHWMIDDPLVLQTIAAALREPVVDRPQVSPT